MTDRFSALHTIAAGDIVHAEADVGASALCLVTAVGASTIDARVVTTQMPLRFSRADGSALWGTGEGSCVIDSIRELPAAIRTTILGLDRKYSGSPSSDSLALSADERAALIFVDHFYRANPITMLSFADHAAGL